MSRSSLDSRVEPRRCPCRPDTPGGVFDLLSSSLVRIITLVRCPLCSGIAFSKSSEGSRRTSTRKNARSYLRLWACCTPACCRPPRCFCRCLRGSCQQLCMACSHWLCPWRRGCWTYGRSYTPCLVPFWHRVVYSQIRNQYRTWGRIKSYAGFC